MSAVATALLLNSENPAVASTAAELLRHLRRRDWALQQLAVLRIQMDAWEGRLQTASSHRQAAFQYSLGLNVEALWQVMLAFEHYEERKWSATQQVALGWLQTTGQEISLENTSGQHVPLLDPLDVVEDVLSGGVDADFSALALEDSVLDSDLDDSEISELDDSEAEDLDSDAELEDVMAACTDQLECFISWDLYGRQC